MKSLSNDARESLVAMIEYALEHRIGMGPDDGYKSFDPDIEHDFVLEVRDFLSTMKSPVTGP